MDDLTIAKLGDMSAEDKTAAFEALEAQLWPEATNKAQHAADQLGITRSSYFGWKRDNRVPDLALLLMQEWARNDTKRDHQLLQAVADDLRTISGLFDQVTQNLSKLGDHLSDVQEQNDAGEPLSSLVSQKSSAE